MKEDIKLSYILTTYNKIEYLKVALPFLIGSCQADEEIVIVDGGSTDGTKEYLSQLKKEGKIHQFISEKDAGEAHGTNKAMLMARGELIKIITDDDVFDFQVIQLSKNFMLKNKAYDLLGFDGLATRMSSDQKEYIQRYAVDDFKNWQAGKTPFLFCGLSILFRRSSLPLLGMFSNNFKIIDYEYTLRVTSLPIQMAWCTGLGYINIANSASNSAKFWKQLKYEYKLVHEIYLNKKKSVENWKSRLVEVRDLFYKKEKALPKINFSQTFEAANLELLKRNKEIKTTVLH